MPIIVTPDDETLDDPCTELWLDPAHLVVSEELEPTLAARAVFEATWAIKTLTGNRFAGPQCREDRYMVRGNQTLIDLDAAVDEVLWAGLAPECSDEMTLIDPCIRGLSLVQFRDHAGCCGTAFQGGWAMGTVSYDMLQRVGPCSAHRDLVIAYRTRNTIPPGADRVVKRLAEEYVKAFCGDKSCKLPERITSITRQGVSWTLLDPQEFLDRGLVGIGGIDHWLNIANQQFRGLSMTDPLRKGVLIRREVLGCGGECGSES